TDAEFDVVNEELKLHPLAVEDAVRGNQRAKIEHYDDSLLVVLKTLRYIEATSDVETGEVMVFLGDRFVVTVRRGEGNPLQEVRHRLEENAEHLALGPAAVLHAVMDSVVDNYTLVDAEIHEDLQRIEQDVFSGARDVDATVIYRLKREVLEIRRASNPLADAMERLFVQPHRAIVDRDGSEVLAFFRDVRDHLLKVNDHVESYDRLLTDILNAHLAQISVRQNDDMRKISAWVAIAAVPTMIAGIYGMNFHTIPELEASVTVGDTEVYYGYFVIVAVMVGACAGLYRAFKRSGWL
ncbi:MAG: magnesium and cobalt transport protein CorA, partial [Lapillicoccus sp.]